MEQQATSRLAPALTSSLHAAEPRCRCFAAAQHDTFDQFSIAFYRNYNERGV
jgi:hypothetical protein